jgi:DNA polymerase III epsilon subunit-like protein
VVTNPPPESQVFVAFDTETTGKTVRDGHRLVEVAALVFDARGTTLGRFGTLIDPGIPIPPDATRVHGITDADVRGKPAAAYAVAELDRWLGQWDPAHPLLLAHNAGFDVGFLEDLARRDRLGDCFWKRHCVLCTQRAAQRQHGGKFRSLSRLYHQVTGGLQPPHGAHRAMTDSEMVRAVWLGLPGEITGVEVPPPGPPVVRRVISGGQTGVDQIALLAAKAYGLETGGVAPWGWLTENGPQPDLGKFFGLVEHASTEYPARTAANVQDSDVTLWLSAGEDTRGQECTLDALRARAPAGYGAALDVWRWAAWHDVAAFLRKRAAAKRSALVVNVAGPRASRLGPDDRRQAYLSLCHLFSLLEASGGLETRPRGNEHLEASGALVGERVDPAEPCPLCRSDAAIHPPDRSRPGLTVLCTGRVVRAMAAITAGGHAPVIASP